MITILDDNNGKGFLDTAADLGRAAYEVAKAAGKAAAGNYIGAAVELAKSSTVRNILIGVISFILILMMTIASLPNMVLRAIMDGKDVDPWLEAQIHILNMAKEINDVFVDDYNLDKYELLRIEKISEDQIISKDPVPPISPYKIMAFYCAVTLDADGDISIDDIIGGNNSYDEQEYEGIRMGTSEISLWAERYREDVEEIAADHDISEYVDILMAILMQESGGRGDDVMQSCGTDTDITPEISIENGVIKFKRCLEKAKCDSPDNWGRLQVALQGYNYGSGYIDWLEENEYNGWMPENAQEFSNIQIEESQDTDEPYDVYGDPEYVAHVFRYIHFTDENFMKKINILDLTNKLREHSGDFYYIEELGGEEYEILFILNEDEDFFIETVFNMTEAQIKLAQSYEEIFEIFGNAELSGYGGGLKVDELTSVEITRYIGMAYNVDPYLTDERRSIVATGLTLVGKVPYFWGGKYPYQGECDEWCMLKKVQAAGDASTGTLQPFGLDCSGFVHWTYLNADLDAGSTIATGGSASMYANNTPISSSELRPGDLGFLLSNGRTTHVGIFVGRDEDGKRYWVHSEGGTGVTINNCNFTHFRKVVD